MEHDAGAAQALLSSSSHLLSNTNSRHHLQQQLLIQQHECTQKHLGKAFSQTGRASLPLPTACTAVAGAKHSSCSTPGTNSAFNRWHELSPSSLPRAPSPAPLWPRHKLLKHQGSCSSSPYHAQVSCRDATCASSTSASRDGKRSMTPQIPPLPTMLVLF